MKQLPRYYDKKFLHFLYHPRDFLYYDSVANGKFPDIFMFRFLWRKVIVCHNPDLVKQILVDEHRIFGKSPAFQVIAEMLGKGLLTAEGDFWKKQRRLIQPAFHKKRLDDVAMIAAKSTERTIAEKLLQNGEKPVDFSREMVALTIEIITKALFGSQISQDVEAVWTHMNYVNKVGIMRIRNPFQPPRWLPTRQNQKVKDAVTLINTVILGIIAERHKTAETHDDLLQMLLDVEDADTGERMSDQQIRDELITLFVAGHETTVNTLTWAIYELGRNDAILAKAKNEINEVLKGKTPGFDDMMRLPYLGQIINETMRLYPPAYAIPRITLEKTTLMGCEIPKGTNVMINAFALHRNPKYWENPLKFQPERFENIDLKGDRKHLFIPFGAGPRICIGNNFALMELTIILAILLQKTNFHLVDKSDIPEDLLISLKVKKPVEVVFKH